jgi:hypothetical protein
MKVEKCQSIAKSGNPCGATVVADGLCAWHAPSWADRRRQWSAEGGRKRANRERAKAAIPDAMTTAEVSGWLGVVFRQVITGKTEPGVASAAAAVARAMIAVNEAGAVERLEARIGELEHRAARRLA